VWVAGDPHGTQRSFKCGSPATHMALKGLNKYKIDSQKADVIIGAVGFTEKRNQLMTYPYAMYKGRMALMIPKPTQRSEHHLDAIWKPFQPQVLYQSFIQII